MTCTACGHQAPERAKFCPECGFGRIDGGGAYADSLAVLWDLADGTGVELGWFWLAWSRNGGLYTIRRTGQVAGGGPFESDYLQLILHARGRMTHVEQFELDDVMRARERFEELGAARKTT